MGDMSAQRAALILRGTCCVCYKFGLTSDFRQSPELIFRLLDLTNPVWTGSIAEMVDVSLYPETPDIDWVLSSNKEEIVMKNDNSKLPDPSIQSDAQSLRLLRFGTAHHCDEG